MRHEVHLARMGLRAVVPLIVVLTAVGAVTGGRHGALSVALAAGVVLLNHALAVASTGWARVLGPGVLAAGLGGFAFRMVSVFAALGLLAGVAWIDDVLFAVTFCSVLVVSLAAECVSYARGSYVPAWRTR